MQWGVAARRFRYDDGRLGSSIAEHELGTRSKPLFSVSNLHVGFTTREGTVQAVRDVSFAVASGECLGLVGESGCGKSASCAAIMGLLPLEATIRGKIIFEGRILNAANSHAAGVRGREIAMVFQDPMASLNPVRRIGSQIADKLLAHGWASRDAALAEAQRLLDRVHVPGAQQRLRDYPHQLSGGLSQRVVIAIAIACGPKLLLADEPTTALDVTIQAQILRLFDELRRDMGMSLVLVTHDLGVLAQVADRVAVMYAGKIVETQPVSCLLERPHHPYTQALLAASPSFERPASRRLAVIAGSVPSASTDFQGCSFGPRCSRSDALCSDTAPTLRRTGPDGAVACHHTIL